MDLDELTSKSSFKSRGRCLTAILLTLIVDGKWNTAACVKLSRVIEIIQKSLLKLLINCPFHILLRFVFVLISEISDGVFRNRI